MKSTDSNKRISLPSFNVENPEVSKSLNKNKLDSVRATVTKRTLYHLTMVNKEITFTIKLLDFLWVEDIKGNFNVKNDR